MLLTNFKNNNRKLEVGRFKSNTQTERDIEML